MKRLLAVCLALFVLGTGFVMSGPTASVEAADGGAPVTVVDAANLPEGFYAGPELPADATVEEMNQSGLRPPPPPSQRPVGPGGQSYAIWTHGGAGEQSHWGSYVGTHSGKDPNISIGTVVVVGCTGPIYQPIWLHLQFVDGSIGWIEQGIAHQCNGLKTQYGFAARNFNPNMPVGTWEGGVWTYYDASQTNHGLHFLEQYRDGDTGAGCAWWGQKVDGILKNGVNFGICGIGIYWEVGLESYRNLATTTGPGSLSTHNWGRVWNGVPGSGRVWVAPSWDYGFLGDQMYGSATGYPYSDWICVKQNVAVSPPSC